MRRPLMQLNIGFDRGKSKIVNLKSKIHPVNFTGKYSGIIFKPDYCNYFFTKTKNMHYNQSCAAKGNAHGNHARSGFIRSMQRAAVNIYKTGNSYELLVFAPGRIKEHFH